MSALLAILFAAAAPAEAQLEALVEQDRVVAKIGYRLVTANAPRCGRQLPASGLLLHGLEQYGGPYAATAARMFALGEAPGILAVAPGSPAEAAGVRINDAVLAINGRVIPPARKGDKAFDRMEGALDALEAALSAGPVTLDLARGDQRLSVRFTGVPACATRFQVKPARRKNAAADGQYVEINSGLLDEFADEDELAAVIAHELAHNILRHREVLDAKGVSRGLFGRFGKNAAKIRETEIEADRYSLLLMRDAGYRMRAALEFWQRFSRRHGGGIFASATHLNGRRRSDLLAEEIARIEAAPPMTSP